MLEEMTMGLTTTQKLEAYRYTKLSSSFGTIPRKARKTKFPAALCRFPWVQHLSIVLFHTLGEI